MNNSPIHIEHILIFVLSFTLLFSLWQNYQARMGQLRKQTKCNLPRKWKPRSPKDRPSCQSGIELAVLKPKTDVIAYSQWKSSRGRTKHLATQGHACLNPMCNYLGVIDHLLHTCIHLPVPTNNSFH